MSLVADKSESTQSVNFSSSDWHSIIEWIAVVTDTSVASCKTEVLVERTGCFAVVLRDIVSADRVNTILAEERGSLPVGVRASDRPEEADELRNISGSGTGSRSGGEDAVGIVGASDLGAVTRVGVRAIALIVIDRGLVVKAIAVTTVLDSEIYGDATSVIANSVSHGIAVEDGV